jgi:hypothetical protein
MTGKRGYNAYFESWTPPLMEDGTEENNLNELFVQETLDPRIESVMPILNRIHKKVSESVIDKEMNKLAEWADSLTEEESIKSNNPVGIPEEEEVDEAINMGASRKRLGDVGGPRAAQNLPAKPAPEKEVDESALQAYLGDKKYGREGMNKLRDAGRKHVGKAKMQKIRAKFSKKEEVAEDSHEEQVARLAAYNERMAGENPPIELGLREVGNWAKVGHHGDPIKTAWYTIAKYGVRNNRFKDSVDRVMSAIGEFPDLEDEVYDMYDINQDEVDALYHAYETVYDQYDQLQGQQDVAEGSGQPKGAGQALQSLKNLALMKSALTFPQLRQAGRESMITDAMNAAIALEQSYMANKQQGNAMFVRGLRDEIDNFKKGYPINSSMPDDDGYAPELGDLLQGRLGKLNFQQGMAEDLDANQKRAGQLGPTGGPAKVGDLVGANENFINTVDQAVTTEDEMDEGEHTQHAMRGRNPGANEFEHDFENDKIGDIHDKISKMLKRLEKPKDTEPNLKDTDLGNTLHEVDTGEYDARKSTHKDNPTPEQEKEFRKKVQAYGKELEQRQKEKDEVKEGQEDFDAILRIISKKNVKESIQLNEGLMDSLNSMIAKIKAMPGIQKYIQMAQSKKAELTQALQHSANGKDLVANIQQAVGGQQAVAEGWGQKIGGAVAASAGGGLLAGAADIMMRAYIAMGKPDLTQMMNDPNGKNALVLVSMLVVLGALAMFAGGHQVKQGMDNDIGQQMREGQEDLDAILRIIKK